MRVDIFVGYICKRDEDSANTGKLVQHTQLQMGKRKSTIPPTTTISETHHPKLRDNKYTLSHQYGHSSNTFTCKKDISPLAVCCYCCCCLVPFLLSINKTVNIATSQSGMTVAGKKVLSQRSRAEKKIFMLNHPKCCIFFMDQSP
jgi:hypothetical protein